MTWEEFFLKLFNYFCILCFKSKSFEISKWNLVLNFIKLFGILFLYIHARMSNVTRKYLKVNTYGGKEKSNFAVQVSIVTTFLYIFLVIFPLIVQNVKCKRIKEIMKQLKQFKMSKKVEKMFHKKFKKRVILFLIWYIPFNTYTTIIFPLQISFSSFVTFSFSHFAQISHFLFVLVIKSIEEFLLLQMRELADDFEVTKVRNSIEKFQKIQKLFDQFEEAFGKQVTIYVSVNTAFLSLNVSKLIFKLTELIYSI